MIKLVEKRLFTVELTKGPAFMGPETEGRLVCLRKPKMAESSSAPFLMPAVDGVSASPRAACKRRFRPRASRPARPPVCLLFLRNPGLTVQQGPGLQSARGRGLAQ